MYMHDAIYRHAFTVKTIHGHYLLTQRYIIL